MRRRFKVDNGVKEASVPRRLRCLAIGSGKGGVGKTMVSVGVATVLTEMGYRVLLFDADMGLANVDLQIGADPKFTLQDVVFGDCPLEKAVVGVPGGPDIIAASSGAREMVSMSPARREMLAEQLIRFSVGYDFLIIDTEAGIGDGAIQFLRSMPQVNVVVANEPTSIMDAYSLIKILLEDPNAPEIRLIINQVQSQEEGQQLAARLNDITGRFLGKKLKLAGIVLHDLVVGDAIRARCSVVKFAPKSKPSLCLYELARSILASNQAREHGKPMDRKAFHSLAGIPAADTIGEGSE
jgi:flagellar biosynthesis protein FlhG